MSERYKRLFSLDENLYQEGSPLIISAGALLLDSISGNTIAQLKFKNIVDSSIKAIKVYIQPLGVTGEKLGDEVEYQYLDLKASRDEEFGQKVPVKLPDKNTRAFNVRIAKVVFGDGTIWQTSNTSFEPLSFPESLMGVLENDLELVNQYKLEFGNNAVVFPVSEKDLWFCHCNAINHSKELKCHKCNATAEKLLNISVEDLKKRQKNRLNEEAYNRAEELFSKNTVESITEGKNILASLSGWKDSDEKIKLYEKRLEELKKEIQINNEKKLKEEKRSKKRNIILLACLAVLAIIAIVIFSVVIPNNKYNSAKKMMTEGNYEEAISLFTELNNYKDSKELIDKCNELSIESHYSEALATLESEDYEQAERMFLELKGYKDSSTYATYAKAINLLNKDLLDEAYSLLQQLKGFKDVDTVLSTLVAVPVTISTTYHSFRFKYVFTYSSDGVMESAEINDGDSQKKYSCGSDGKIISLYFKNKYQTSTWDYTYQDDGTVKNTSSSGKMEHYYDKNGMVIKIISDTGELEYGPYVYDSHNNPYGQNLGVNQSITNYYEDDMLVKTEHTYGNSVKETEVAYKVLHNTNNCNLEKIWKNVRLVIGDEVWSYY